MRAAQEAETEKAEEIDETTVRVALGALEQVGVLRRHCDLPESAQLRLSPSDGAAAQELARALDVAPGNRVSREMFEVAAALGCPPSAVEERLLTLEDERVLAYYGTGRGLLVEFLPQPADLGERLRGLLAAYERAQEQRVAEIALYATSTRHCRTAMIARHFGVSHPGRCDHCDVCTPRQRSGRATVVQTDEAPTPSAPAQPERAPEDIILECVAELPFPLGRTGLVNVLKGSVQASVKEDRSRHFGALAALTKSAIEQDVERLVEAGYLRREERQRPDGTTYNILAVTPEGFAKPAAPWPPPRPVAPPRPASRRSAGAALSAAPAPELLEEEDDAAIEERFEMLRAWRREQVRGTTLPAYTVLGDETLRLLAARRITSLDDLSRVKGIGPAKLEKYGHDLLELLSEEVSGEFGAVPLD